MHFHFLSAAQLAETLEQSRVLAIVTAPDASQTVYLIEFDGQDLAISVAAGAEWAAIWYPPSSFDGELDGSIHDEARRLSNGGRAGAQ